MISMVVVDSIEEEKISLPMLLGSSRPFCLSFFLSLGLAWMCFPADQLYVLLDVILMGFFLKPSCIVLLRILALC